METETSDNINDYLVGLESKNIHEENITNFYEENITNFYEENITNFYEENITNFCEENIQDYLKSNLETSELKEQVINFNDFMKKIISKIEKVKNPIDEDENVDLSSTNQYNSYDNLSEYIIEKNDTKKESFDDEIKQMNNLDNINNTDNLDNSDNIEEDHDSLEKIFFDQQNKEMIYKDIEGLEGDENTYIKDNQNNEEIKSINFEDFKKEQEDNNDIDKNPNIELDNLVDNLYKKYEKYIVEKSEYSNKESSEELLEINNIESNQDIGLTDKYYNPNIIIYDGNKVLNQIDNITVKPDNNIQDDIQYNDINDIIKKMDEDESNIMIEEVKCDINTNIFRSDDNNDNDENDDNFDIDNHKNISDSELDEDTDKCIKNRYKEQKFNLINSMLINLGIYKNPNLPNINLTDIIKIVESIENNNIKKNI